MEGNIEQICFFRKHKQKQLIYLGWALTLLDTAWLQPEKLMALGTFWLVMAKYFLKMKRILQTSPCLLLLIFATNDCCEVVSWKQNQVALVLICFELICVFVFIMFWRLFLVKCTFLFCSDLASLMFNIILTIYFSLLKMQSLSLTNHILLKLFFAIFDKFTICLLLKLNN